MCRFPGYFLSFTWFKQTCGLRYRQYGRGAAVLASTDVYVGYCTHREDASISKYRRRVQKYSVCNVFIGISWQSNVVETGWNRRLHYVQLRQITSAYHMCFLPVMRRHGYDDSKISTKIAIRLIVMVYFARMLPMYWALHWYATPPPVALARGFRFSTARGHEPSGWPWIGVPGERSVLYLHYCQGDTAVALSVDARDDGNAQGSQVEEPTIHNHRTIKISMEVPH